MISYDKHSNHRSQISSSTDWERREYGLESTPEMGTYDFGHSRSDQEKTRTQEGIGYVIFQLCFIL